MIKREKCVRVNWGKLKDAIEKMFEPLDCDKKAIAVLAKTEASPKRVGFG